MEWIRRGLSLRRDNNNQSSKNRSSSPEDPQNRRVKKGIQVTVEEDEDLLGVTQQLIDHVSSFSIDTFKNFPLQEEEEATTTAFSDQDSVTAKPVGVQKDLSDWQERHAVLILSKSKELSKLRFTLCPRHLKERQFWRIYFTLVKSRIAEYELQAVRLAKLRSMATEKVKAAESNGFEVEMAETKQAMSTEPSTP